MEGLQARERKVQLERGTWLHTLLQEYYNGNDWKAKHKELTKAFYNLMEEERIDLGDMPKDCLRIMRAYLRTYQDDFSRYVVVDTELDETITFKSGLQMRIIVDLILEDKRSGLLFAWDHKSRTKFETGDNMMLDPQLTRYYYGLHKLGYRPLGGVGYNELRTKPPAIPELVYVGKANEGLSRRKDIDTDVYTYMKAIRDNNLNPADYQEILQLIATRQKDKFFRRTIMPKDPPMIRTMMKEVRETADEMVLAEAADRFPRTFEKSCAYTCDYKSLCLAELHGGNIQPLIKMNYTTREQRERMAKRGKRQKQRDR